MKALLKIVVVFFVIMIPVFVHAEPHLILNFDINKTLIASDKAGNKTVEDVLNELLAEKYSDCWDSSMKTPMTFDAYVNEILVPGDKDDRTLRNERRLYLHHFLDYLSDHDHPLYQTALQDYHAALAVLYASKGSVFPSFYQLIDELDRKGISYSIILRSFGEEVLEVKEEIESNHRITFSQTGKFREGVLVLADGSMMEDSAAIFTWMRTIGHAAIHDDWNYWDAHGMSSKYGKPFYLDDNHETLSLFFDDSIRFEDSIKNILAPMDAKTGESISMKQLMESRQAVRIDTLEAILRANYYIDCVQEALDAYQYPLKSQAKA